MSCLGDSLFIKTPLVTIRISAHDGELVIKPRPDFFGIARTSIEKVLIETGFFKKTQDGNITFLYPVEIKDGSINIRA